MRTIILAAAVLTAVVSAPVQALTVDLSGITPVLTFPEPVEDTVTKDAGGINK